MKNFDTKSLQDLYVSPQNSNGEDNGQITIIGNSDLFHGPLIFALKASSRIVDMVFFASPWEPTKDIAAYLKAEVGSFIWVPFEEVDKYIEKSDAVLIGPGMKRYNSESDINAEDDDYKLTRKITKDLLSGFKNKKWVIDAGSLQTMDPEWIPENSIITPNDKEFEMLFGENSSVETASKYAKKHKCVIVLKNEVSHVVSESDVIEIKGGNAGLTKGGTGDVQAGLTTALLAKNDSVLSASAASYVVKKAAEELAIDVGTYYNADDLANQIPYTLNRLTIKK